MPKKTNKKTNKMIKKTNKMIKKTNRTIKKIAKVRRKKNSIEVVKRLLGTLIILMLVNDVIELAIAYRAYRRELRQKAEEHLAKGRDET